MAQGQRLGPTHPGPVAPRRGRARNQRGGQSRPGQPARRGVSRHRVTAEARADQTAPAVDVSPIHGARGCRHHLRTHGGRADLSLRDGRYRGRPGHRRGDGPGTVRGRRVLRRNARLQPAGRQFVVGPSGVRPARRSGRRRLCAGAAQPPGRVRRAGRRRRETGVVAVRGTHRRLTGGESVQAADRPTGHDERAGRHHPQGRRDFRGALPLAGAAHPVRQPASGRPSPVQPGLAPGDRPAQHADGQRVRGPSGVGAHRESGRAYP